MKRRRGLGGSGGSGRKRRGLSGRRSGSGKDSGDDGAVVGGGGDEDDSEGGGDEDGAGDEDDSGGEDDDKPRRPSRRRSGRRASGSDDDDDDDRGFDRQRQQAEAQKSQQQMIMIVGGGIGLLLIIVLGLALSGDSGSRHSDDENTKGPAAIKRVDVEVDDVRRLANDAKASMRDAMSVEGGARVTRLEQAKRSIDQAAQLIERKRKSVPNPAARGPSFEQLDMAEQDMNQTFVMVRKALAEERQ